MITWLTVWCQSNRHGTTFFPYTYTRILKYLDRTFRDFPLCVCVFLTSAFLHMWAPVLHPSWDRNVLKSEVFLWQQLQYFILQTNTSVWYSMWYRHSTYHVHLCVSLLPLMEDGNSWVKPQAMKLRTEPLCSRTNIVYSKMLKQSTQCIRVAPLCTTKPNNSGIKLWYSRAQLNKPIFLEQ